MFDEFLGKKVLIIGDVGRGKTRLTRRLLIEALKKGYGSRITVIDMAPKQVSFNGLSVGGKILKADESKVRYLNCEDVKTPRLSARSPNELRKLAEHNRRILEKLLERFIASPTQILFINDVSLYLQGGNFDLLWSALEKADTAIINGYYGEKLQDDLGTGLSERERRLIKKLAAKIDVLVQL
ncbi:TPA: hypothetical protein EYP75_04520 [Candidatus Bathyarchaeota archaeon]|nr:hypothetical protein [Candidatus Bathyarchaeota archaeon]